LPASVTRLQPLLGSFDEALLKFRAAHLHACLSMLHGIESPEAATLRARTSLRLGDPKGARDGLRGFKFRRDGDRAEAALLLAVAHSRLGDREQSDAAFLDAFVVSVSSSDVGLEAEVEYYRGLTAFADSNLSEARSACLRGLAVVNAASPSSKTRGSIPLEHVISRTEELLGVIEAGQGRYHAWLGYARKALATLDGCATPDVFQEAFALRNLAILARDFDIADDVRIVETRVPTFAWTNDICRVEFATAEALGWCFALRGNCIEALRLFRQADESASTIPERVIIGVNRALVAREFGHGPSVNEEIQHALKLARTFDWEMAAGDTRYALLAIAQIAAKTATPHAREMLDRHTAIRVAIDGTSVARLEPGARAEEAYTHGLVLRAEGRLTDSAERLQVAFETWASIGFEWRSARAALELAELGAGDVFRLAIRRELLQRPESVFAARARLIA